MDKIASRGGETPPPIRRILSILGIHVGTGCSRWPWIPAKAGMTTPGRADPGSVLVVEGDAAFYGEDGAGDEGGGIAGEEEHGAGDVGWRADAI